MSGTAYALTRLPFADKTSWTIPFLDNRARPFPWASLVDYTAPVSPHPSLLHGPAGDATDTVFLSDLYAIPERADELEDLTGSSWCSVLEDAHAPDDSFDLEDDGEPGPDRSAPGGEVCHSFVFRGAQHDTVRTIIRADPTRALASPRLNLLPHSLDDDSYSETSSLSGDPDDASAWGDPTPETPTPAEPESCPPSPALTPVAAAHSAAVCIAARQHLEEDLDFREHEWLLQQIGCGRLEIWVSEERLERTDSVVVAEEHRPRVFFAPTSNRRPSAVGLSAA